MLIARIVTSVVVLLSLAGCGSGSESLKSSAGSEARPLAPAMPPPAGEPQAIPADARMVIRTASMSLVVENAAEHMNRAIAVVTAEGGYVADSRQWLESGQLRATGTFRVPAEKLSATLEQIRKDAIRVMSEGINGQDVSEEYADLGARLTNLRATETELRQLLTTIRERTQKAAEILEIHNEVSKVRGEIDRLQGRMDYLRKMTAMSTINLELIPDKLSEPIIEPGWSPRAIARSAARSLVAGLEALGSILIWIVVFVAPMVIVLGIIAAVGFRIWRVVRRRFK